MSADVRVRPKPGVRCKAMRAAWTLVWLVLYRPSPRPLHGWRRLLLRLFAARVGRGAMPYAGARIWAPWNLTMEARAVLADGVDCYSVDRIVLGAGAVVSQRAFLCAAGHDPHDPAFPLVSAPIVVGPGAWVAAEAFVGPGVALGPGAVVAARAVALRDVAARTIVAGNPARVVALRGEAAPRDGVADRHRAASVERGGPARPDRPLDRRRRPDACARQPVTPE